MHARYLSIAAAVSQPWRLPRPAGLGNNLYLDGGVLDRLGR